MTRIDEVEDVMFPDVVQTDLQLVPLENIVFSDIKIREAQVDDPKFKELKESIRLQGLGQPVVLRPYKHEGRIIPNKFEGVDGCQRTTACRQLGMKAIPAVITNMTDDQVRAFQLSLNRNRVPQTKKQELDQIIAFMAGHPMMSQQEVARHFGMTPETMSNIVGLQRLVPAAMELLENNKMVPSSAIALSRLPEELQEKYLEEAQSMPSGSFTDLCKKVRDEWRKQGTVDKDSIRHYALKPKKEIITWLEQEEAKLEMLPTDDADYRIQSTVVNILQKCLQVDAETVAAKKAEAASKSQIRADEKLKKQLKDMEEKQAKLLQQLKEAEAQGRFASAAV